MDVVVKEQPYKIFRRYFGVRNLTSVYQSKLKGTRLKGVDRIDSFTFSEKSDDGKRNREKSEIKIISRKALDSTYMFSPYLELLKGKGRGKQPRILAVPTIRDRIALYALKEVLFEIFPECVNRKFANTVIRNIKNACVNLENSQIGFFRTDIKNFYGSINQDTLFHFIGKDVKSKKMKTMIERAITRPIVPKIYKRNELNGYKVSGIPQGLSISNILAEIYMRELDKSIEDDPRVFYYSRYVDDILVLTEKNCLSNVINDLRDRLEDSDTLGLSLNRDKTFTNDVHLSEFNISDSFEYLGYQFDEDMVPSPKKTSEEKLIRSVTGLFCEYKNALRLIQKSRKKAANKTRQLDCLKKTFLFRLNEKITGSISEKKKYGWIFYFIEIGDTSSLHRIDSIIAKLFQKTDGFGGSAPCELKKLVRAYFEAVHSPESGYIHNYTQYDSSEQRRDFLIENGYIDPSKPMSLKKSDRKFYLVRSLNLSRLLQDETFLY